MNRGRFRSRRTRWWKASTRWSVTGCGGLRHISLQLDTGVLPGENGSALR